MTIPCRRLDQDDLKRLAIVINIFGDGAVPNIILDLYPFIVSAGWIVKVIALQPIDSQQACVQKAEQLGVSLISLDCQRTEFFKTYIRLRKALAEFSPSLVHSHLGRADFFSAIASSSNLPVVTTFHNVRSHYNIISRLGYQLTDFRVSARVCVSQKVKNSWYSDGLISSKRTVIYNPVGSTRLIVSKSREDVRGSLGLDAGETMLLTSGRLVPMKGQKVLIEAMPAVLSRYPTSHLFITGIGILEKPLRRLCDNLKISDAVTFLGFRHDLPDLIAAADLFIFPSLWEGLGLVALEAMMLKTPLVASNIAPISEYVVDGETGKLATVNNPTSLAESIIAMLSNTKEADHLAEKAFHHVREKFDVKKIAEEYLQLYESLVS